MPQSEDPILTAEVPCPKHDRLQQDLLKSEEFQNINLELADLYQNISNATGYSVEKLDISSFSGLFSTITIYRGYNLTLPDWTEYYWHDIKSWAAKKFQLPTYTPELARLRTGPFFNYLLNYFTAVKDQTSMLVKPIIERPRRDLKEIVDVTVPKFLMLSVHDTTIGDRTNALGVYPDAVPEFASTVIWEVRSNGSSVYLNMYFKNSTGLSQLTVPGCQFDCSLDDLAAILEPLRTTDDEWTAECNEE